MTHSIFDGTFNGMGGSEFYRATVIPELYPNHGTVPRYRLENWPQEDVDVYVHGKR